MAADKIGTLADRIIKNLSVMIAEKQMEANAIADTIGSDQHHKSLGAQYEAKAEQAQNLAGFQAAMERLQASGFVS